MFSEVPEKSQVMYPDGTIKTKAEVIKDYPILGTSMGVIGFTTDDAGTVGDLIMMGYYDSYPAFKDCYTAQGAQVTSEMSMSEGCAVITEFVNNPLSEQEEALDAYLAL